MTIALHRLLVGLGLCRMAFPAVIATALGSSLWSVASQALWQHGPAALALTLTMLLLHPRSVSRGRMVLAGLATAMLVVARPLDLIFALFVFVWVAWTHPRRLAWFLPAPVVLGLASWGTMSITSHGSAVAKTSWSSSTVSSMAWEARGLATFGRGMAGTLLSPNRGLFIFSPWVAVAVAVSPVAVRKLATGSLVRWLLLALVPYLFVLSKYAVWWAGGSFGPRYWTEAFPLFGVLLACGLNWAWDRSRGLMALFAVTILLSVIVHAIGAFCFPSTCKFFPVDIDIHHERLWDWRDTELSRCIKESLLGEPVPIRLPGR